MRIINSTGTYPTPRRSLRRIRARPPDKSGRAVTTRETRGRRRRRRAYLLLRLVQPPAAVPAAAVGRHPFSVTADVLETRRARLLDFIDLQIHLAVFLVRDAFEHRAVARPVSGVRRSGACKRIGAPVYPGSRSGAYRTHKGLLLALGLLHIGRHGVAGAEALAHTRVTREHWLRLGQKRLQGWRRSADATNSSLASARQSLVLTGCRLAGEQLSTASSKARASEATAPNKLNTSAAVLSATPARPSARLQQWRPPNNKRARARGRAA